MRLRMLDVPGERIGEILAEIEAHVAATGEPAREAFGPPADYAQQWKPSVEPERRPARRRATGFIGHLAIGLGISFGLVHAAYEVGRGVPVWGVSGWWWMALGLLLVVGSAARVPFDPIVDPRSGQARSNPRRVVVVGVAAVTGLVLAGGMVAVGRLVTLGI